MLKRFGGTFVESSCSIGFVYSCLFFVVVFAGNANKEGQIFPKPNAKILIIHSNLLIGIFKCHRSGSDLFPL